MAKKEKIGYAERLAIESEEYGITDVKTKADFEAKMLRIVNKDIERAKKFLNGYHDQCVERHRYYHNARLYDDYNAKNLFPVSFFQEQVDVFTSDLMDKLFYKNEPCTMVGRKTAEPKDVELKQQMMDYQDGSLQDNAYGKLESAARDCAIYGMCGAQVDYDEEFDIDYFVEETPVMINDLVSGQQVSLMGDDGLPITQKEIKKKKIPIYKGPRTRRVDPTDVFFTEDKQGNNDREPIMIRSWKTREDFLGQKYYINTDKLPRKYGSTASSGDETSRAKRTLLGFDVESGKSKKAWEYFEWQGWVDKKELYKYLRLPIDEETYEENEKCLAVIGVCEDKYLVRLEEAAIDIGRPNVIIGVISREEDEVSGGSIADKILAVQKAMEKTAGIILANLKLSVNAGHVVNRNQITNEGDIDINAEGFVLETTGDVRQVHARIEQPKVAPDLYAWFDILKYMGQAASGINDPTSGRGDPNAETLGEVQILSNQNSKRLIAYLKSFENSFIVPWYSIRNQINMEFLDDDYIFLHFGESGLDWKTITREQLVASVMFRCESASRETNRAVITQQILQATQIAPLAIQAGQPVRIDKMLYELYTSGFSWSAEKAEDYLPLIRMEKNTGQQQMDELLVKNAINAQLMMALQGLLAGANGNGAKSPNEEIPQPTDEAGAVNANQSRQRTGVI